MARAILFLASDAAADVTGTLLGLTGNVRAPREAIPPARGREDEAMKITDVTLTLFAWDDIPPTTYGRHTGKFGGQSQLGLLTLRPTRASRATPSWARRCAARTSTRESLIERAQAAS